MRRTSKILSRGVREGESSRGRQSGHPWPAGDIGGQPLIRGPRCARDPGAWLLPGAAARGALGTSEEPGRDRRRPRRTRADSARPGNLARHGETVRR